MCRPFENHTELRVYENNVPSHNQPDDISFARSTIATANSMIEREREKGEERGRESTEDTDGYKVRHKNVRRRGSDRESSFGGT